MRNSFTTTSEANDFVSELVKAAGEASKLTLGEVSYSYVVGALSCTIKGLLLDMKHDVAKEVIEREVGWLKARKPVQ
jgi:hypothetical protein